MIATAGVPDLARSRYPTDRIHDRVDCAFCCKQPSRLGGVTPVMHVRDGMSEVVLTVGPGHTLREAAKAMAARRVGAAVVMDPDAPGPGIITERDLLDSIGRGEDPDTERVADHLTSDTVFAAPSWSLEEAAVAMVRGGFRHLIVCNGGEVAGVLSVRDIVRVWTADGSICDVPSSAAAGAVG